MNNILKGKLHWSPSRFSRMIITLKSELKWQSTPLTNFDFNAVNNHLNFLWINLPLAKHHMPILPFTFYDNDSFTLTLFLNPLKNYYLIPKTRVKIPILPFDYYWNPHIFPLFFLSLPAFFLSFSLSPLWPHAIHGGNLKLSKPCTGVALGKGEVGNHPKPHLKIRLHPKIL